MKKNNITIAYNYVDLPDGRKVMLGKHNETNSIIFERPVDEADKLELPEYAFIEDDKLVTRMPLSEEALEALVFLYLERREKDA